MFNISQYEQKFALLELVNNPVEYCTDGDISSEFFLKVFLLSRASIHSCNVLGLLQIVPMKFDKNKN